MGDRQRLAVGCVLLLVGLVLCAVVVTAPTGGSALGVVLAGPLLLLVGWHHVVRAVKAANDSQ